MTIASVVVLGLAILSAFQQPPTQDVVTRYSSPPTCLSVVDGTGPGFKLIGGVGFTQQQELRLLLQLKEHQIHYLRRENYFLWEAIRNQGSIHRSPVAIARSMHPPIAFRHISTGKVLWL